MHKIRVHACTRAGFTPNIAVMGNDMKCHEKLIESGLGIGLARENAPNGNKARALNVSDFNEIYNVYTYYKNSAAYGNVKLFLNFLKTKVK